MDLRDARDRFLAPQIFFDEELDEAAETLLTSSRHEDVVFGTEWRRCRAREAERDETANA